MSNAIVGGQITVTIGSTPITLTTADLTATPMVYTLPAGQSIDISLSDLNTYLNTNFNIPTISFPGITEANIVISSFTISTAGLFEIAVDFVFGSGTGWQVFPNLPGFLLNTVGLTVSYASLPVIASLNPSTGTTGTSVTINGYDLGAATVDFGSFSASPITNNTATSLTVPVPSGLTAGTVNVTVKNADGTSDPYSFTFTSS